MTHPAAPTPIEVMLVDDHPSFRAAARWLLETEGYVVVAEAASGERALETVAEAQPELVLLDIGLPGIDGFQVALAMRARCPRALALGCQAAAWWLAWEQASKLARPKRRSA